MLTPQSRHFTPLLAALTALTALSIDMSLPAQPVLQRVFHASVASVQLTLSLFLLGFAAGQAICGPLSDLRGRKPVLLAGVTLFIVAGLACAISPSLPLLILGRFLQGLGASVGPIVARAIVRDSFDARQGAGVLSQITQVMMIAPLVAPTLGGGLMALFGWRSIFVLLALCGAALGLICHRRLPETRDAARQAAPAGSVLDGFRAVFRHRVGFGYTLLVCFAYSGMFAYISGSPFVLMGVYGVAGTRFGLFFAMTAVALMLGATLNRALLARHAPTVLLRGGVSVLLGAGIALAALVWGHWGGLAGVLVPVAAYLFGLGLTVPNAIAAAMEPHGRQAGIASSAIGCLQTAGGALAGFCVGTFYRHTACSLAGTLDVFAVLTVVTYISLKLRRRAESRAVGLSQEAESVGLLLLESAE